MARKHRSNSTFDERSRGFLAKVNFPKDQIFNYGNFVVWYGKLPNLNSKWVDALKIGGENKVEANKEIRLHLNQFGCKPDLEFEEFFLNWFESRNGDAGKDKTPEKVFSKFYYGLEEIDAFVRSNVDDPMQIRLDGFQVGEVVENVSLFARIFISPENANVNSAGSRQGQNADFTEAR